MLSPSRISVVNRVPRRVPGFRQHAQRFSGLLVLLTALAPSIAPAQVQSLGDLSFVIPTGWSYEQKPGTNFATTSLPCGKDHCVLSISAAIPRTQAVDQTYFATLWTKLITPTLHFRFPGGSLGEHRSVSGYPGREMYGGDERIAVVLTVLETGVKVVPIIFLGPSRSYHEGYYAVNDFLDGVRVGAIRAQPPKTTITMAELAGEWSNDFAHSQAYVNRYSGAYAGTSTIAGGSGYTIAADGSYTSEFQGINNGEIIKDKSAGRVELTDGHIVFRDRDGKHSRDYLFIHSEVAPDGSTILTLLESQYPMSPKLIGEQGKKWMRPAPKK